MNTPGNARTPLPSSVYALPPRPFGCFKANSTSNAPTVSQLLNLCAHTRFDNLFDCRLSYVISRGRFTVGTIERRLFTQKAQYPTLSQMAIEILSIPAMAAE